MKVFISWSGERSQAIAQALRDWVPLVLHFVEPWLSKSDINAGERWALEIAKELEANDCGIICITRENVDSPWILFESGALAKSMQQGRVIPLLFNIDFSDISGPLAQFQAKKIDKTGVGELIASINKISQQAVPEGRLSDLFDMAWPRLEQKISGIPDAAPAKHNRPSHEILEELVTGIRRLEIRFREGFEEGPRTRRRKYSPMMIEEMMFDSKIGRRDPIQILILASVLKESFPWIYELGVDAYRALSDGSLSKQKEALQRFSTATHFLRRGPFLEEAGLDKTIYMMVRELDRFLIDADTESEDLRKTEEKAADSGES
jgi:hypothetical protein